MAGRSDLVYLELRDAISCIEQKVNLIGIVIEVGIPKKSRGTDYFCTLKMMDISYQSPGLSVIFFAENKEKLPHIKSVGDIIRLHSVVMKIHDGDVYATFKKKLSSFALFYGKFSEDISPYQDSSGLQIIDTDKLLIKNLRTWLVGNQFDTGTNELLLPLKDIKVGKSFDLICKIICAREFPEDRWLLFVWDGTDAPPISLPMKLDDGDNQLPLLLEPLPLPRNALCTFPCLGTILRVIIDKELGLQVQGGGQWVKLRNLSYEVRFGLWQGVLWPSSQLRLLSNEDKAVIHLERCYTERLSSGLERLPLSSFPWPSRITVCGLVPKFFVGKAIYYGFLLILLPPEGVKQTSRRRSLDEIDHEQMPFSTLMDVLTHSEVTYRFKCVVRVVEIYPCRPEVFRSLTTHVYRIRLTLEDPTARIHAFVFGEDGVKFFGGYPPIDVVTSKTNQLLGITESVGGEEGGNNSRNPPWVQLCLKSYYLDKSDAWATRNYRIFGTTLVA
ncbi:protection of telomeres protein 1b-like isoform X2 [Tasmannia lanceolata]|uniref:protection of telomeres protein 1b-like isoform X2 n=1 Tax=Tasmannia lanceolata TaxID=3420 RepID=UPI004062A6EE